MQMRTSVKGRSCDWWCNCQLPVLREFGGDFFMWLSSKKQPWITSVIPSVKAAEKDLTIPAQRRCDPVALRHWSGTTKACFSFFFFFFDLPRIHQFILVCLLYSVRFASILLVWLQCLALRLVQVMEGNNKCSIWSCSGWLPPVTEYKFLSIKLVSDGVVEGVLELIQSMPAWSGTWPIVPMSPLCCQ